MPNAIIEETIHVSLAYYGTNTPSAPLRLTLAPGTAHRPLNYTPPPFGLLVSFPAKALLVPSASLRSLST